MIPPLGATDLLVDRSTGRLWVFAAADGDGPTASSYDLDTLARLSVVRLPSHVNSAAVLGDAIWLGTDGGVYVLRRGATAAALVSRAWPDVVSIVADPARDQLIAVTISMPAQLLRITPSGTIGRIAQLPTGRSSLAVVDGAMWVAGFGPTRHVFRLDPDAWNANPPSRSITSWAPVPPSRQDTTLCGSVTPPECPASTLRPGRRWLGGRV